jgi:hypothetical protein
VSVLEKHLLDKEVKLTKQMDGHLTSLGRLVSPQARLGENLLKRLTPSHNQEDPKPNSL